MGNDGARLALKHNLSLRNNSSRRIDDHSLDCERLFLSVTGSNNEARSRTENDGYHAEANCVAKHLLILTL